MATWKIATNTASLRNRLKDLLPDGYECQVMEGKNPAPDNIVAWFIDCESDNLPELTGSSFDGLLFTSKPQNNSDGVFDTHTSPEKWQELFHLIGKFSEQRNLLREQQRLNSKITQIGIALSSEKDLSHLLSMILEEGRNLAECEAASLYLVDRSDKQHSVLKFMLFQNEKLDVPFKEKQYPLDYSSMAGYVTLTGETLNIPDVYQLDDDVPFRFEDSFDRTYGYRTREVLTIPMRNHQNEIIGILQFLNRKKEEFQGKPFDSQTCELLSALSSQSAVAIDNSLLIENIRELFEGFVSAAVSAIEARDPITSGHSFRVADYTCHLAEKLELHPTLKSSQLSSSDMRELRYAALLHDFGKVGVREHILQKAKKLNPLELELIRLRLKWLKQKLRADFYQSAFENRTVGTPDFETWFEKHQEENSQHTDKLEYYLSIIEEANEPSILHQDKLEHLITLKEAGFEAEGQFHEIITEREFLALSVTKGSLTNDERDEIQSHVNHTLEFLSRIPWTQDLQNIPHIAGAHHEKLDGSGYPFGLTAADIPIQTRMMTIADIYDALTAADRPYKDALPHEKALNILETEADQGQLDRDLVDLFIEAKAFNIH